MTKPRFTPDPAPHNIDPKVHEYLLRQLERISDLWPKDLEARLAHLEELAEAKAGLWPIVDTTYANFGFAYPVDTRTACDFASPLNFVGSSGLTDNYKGGWEVSVGNDGEEAVLGRADDDKIETYYKSGGVWVLGPILRASDWTQDTDSFGYGGAYSSVTGQCAVGSPYSDQSGFNAGAVFTYSGSPKLGFTKDAFIASPSAQGRGRFGYATAISRDGNVMAIVQPGTQSYNSNQYVFIYDWNGFNWVYRNNIYELSTDIGITNVKLSWDGKIIAVGDSGHGVGATGQVRIYDDVSGTFTLRQTIDRISLTAEGLPGGWAGSNNSRWGGGVAFSDNADTLFIRGNYEPNFTNVYAHVFVYKLNTLNNQYEFCKLISRNQFDSPATYNTFGLDVIFNSNMKKVFCVMAAGLANMFQEFDFD